MANGSKKSALRQIHRTRDWQVLAVPAGSAGSAASDALVDRARRPTGIQYGQSATGATRRSAIRLPHSRRKTASAFSECALPDTTLLNHAKNTLKPAPARQRSAKSIVYLKIRDRLMHESRPGINERSFRYEENRAPMRQCTIDAIHSYQRL
jgi:hypothetical protein